MDPALTINDQPDHGPADPFINIDDLPEGDVAALEKALADPLPPPQLGAKSYHPMSSPVYERFVAAQKSLECHSLTCVACGNPTLMADFEPHTATCKACAAAERRLNELVAPNWSGEP